MTLEYGKTVDNLTADEAKEIAQAGNVGIVLATGELTPEVKTILTTAKIRFWDNMTPEKIKKAMDDIEEKRKTYMRFNLIGNTLTRQPDDKSGIRHSFMADDIFATVDDEEIFEIESVYVSPVYRRKGIGSKLVKEVLELHNDKIICCAAALLVGDDFPEEPTSEQYDQHLETLSNFFTKLGFISINKHIGYEYREAFVYGNVKGKALIAEFDRLFEEWQKENNQ